MNYCLRNECKNGYAVIHGFLSSAYDHFGSFRYDGILKVITISLNNWIASHFEFIVVIVLCLHPQE